nr:YerC/YecD family TrpR-related protein [Paenibacillus shirakamiensis]
MLEKVGPAKYNEGTVTVGDDKSVQLKKLNDKSIDQLFEAVLTLKNVEECYVFFDDLCTVNEIQSLSQRLEVARMLGKGCTYNQIEAETGASTATISRVKRCLNYGNDGYKMSLERLGR